MAPPPGALRVGRYFAMLTVLFAVLIAIVFWPGTDHSPRLGVDLRGGAQVTLKAQTTTGRAPSHEAISQAKDIIEQRVNGLGVEQSTVVVQGNDEIVVTVAGDRATQLQSVGSTALLNFRPLIAGGFATSASTLDQSTLGYALVTSAQQTQITKFACGDAVSQNPKDTVVVCNQGKTAKYLLGPVLVPGTEVAGASASAPNAQTGQLAWTVLISLKSTGQRTWSEYTAAHHNPDPGSSALDSVAANYVAFTLDDELISMPSDITTTINGSTEVSGSFTQAQATDLANSLKYGALPLKFTTETASTVSATLGSAQLKAGLLAGGIGLALVVLYSLIYYRALGLVTVSSLLVSGGLTYASLVILGSQIGFTLTLAGIAGFIVAVGITADSFVVLFERIKDEVHEGRTMRVAVPRAWIRARRTIISADIVSFLAAAVLYEFAAGDVRGFAFTLGMSTILDLVVVFLFTHPLVSLLSRSAAFGSARFTGLNAVREGDALQSAAAT